MRWRMAVMAGRRLPNTRPSGCRCCRRALDIQRTPPQSQAWPDRKRGIRPVTAILSLLGVNRMVAAGLLVTLLFGAGWWVFDAIGDRREARVRDQIEQQDQKGAKNVRETAEETLRELGGLPDADDIDDSLRATGGLREDPQ